MHDLLRKKGRKKLRPSQSLPNRRQQALLHRTADLEYLQAHRATTDQYRREKTSMKMKVFLNLALAAAALVGVSAQGQTSTWTIDPAHSSAGFQIRHLGVSNVHGTLGAVNGTIVLDEKDVIKSTVTATVDTTTLSTSNETRDKHLKSPDFFDVTKNPTITFKSTSLTKTGGKLQLIGDLTINGVTKSVTLDVDGPAPPQKGMQGKIVSGFSATGVIHRSDFSFGPKFAPPMVGDDVTITIDLEIDKKV
jgi:polyisoprenoid-binding protein YceI